jgi:hypothetical protein
MNWKKMIISLAALAGLAAALGGQTITVTAPNGGERWLLGDPVNITWTSTSVSGDVRILLLRSGGASVGTIATAVPATAGSFLWEAGALAVGSAEAGESYLIRIRAAGGDAVDDSNAAFALVARLPNIHCGSMGEIGWDHTFLPRTFTAGDTVTILYHLSNESAYAAGPFHVGLRVGGAIVARNAHPELASSDTASGEFSWTATCGSAVAVVADCDGEVTESNEGDNVMTDAGLACSQPDLNFFREISCSGGDATKAGLNYEFRAQVDAQGARADNVRVLGGVVGGAVLYDHTFPTLAAEGGIERVSFVWEVPEGAHRVYFEIDPDNAVHESNERNNRQELAVTGVASTPATEHYDLRIGIDRGRSFGARLGEITLPLGRPVTICGEVRGATGAIRDFKVTGTVLGRVALASLTKVYEEDFNDPGMLVVPFSFTWTPDAVGEFTIAVKAALGPHAVGAGVVDSDPVNNVASVIVRVAKSKPSLH